jgi:hypothetical protein
VLPRLRRLAAEAVAAAVLEAPVRIAGDVAAQGAAGAGLEVGGSQRAQALALAELALATAVRLRTGPPVVATDPASAAAKHPPK